MFNYHLQVKTYLLQKTMCKIFSSCITVEFIVREIICRSKEQLKTFNLPHNLHVRNQQF